jgi:hypothetical protein
MNIFGWTYNGRGFIYHIFTKERKEILILRDWWNPRRWSWEYGKGSSYNSIMYWRYFGPLLIRQWRP